MHARIRAFFLLSTVLVGCRPWGLAHPDYPVPAPFADLPPNLARVCVLRANDFDNSTAFPTWDNGAIVGATRGGTYFCYLAEPGIHELVMGSENKANTSGVFEPGKSYYLQHEVLPSAGITNCKPIWISEGVAKVIISQGSYEVLTEVPSGFALPARNAVIPARGSQGAPAVAQQVQQPPTAPR